MAGKARWRRWRVRLLFEPRDLWLGVFWDRRSGYAPGLNGLWVYVCLFPCLPIKFEFRDDPKPL